MKRQFLFTICLVLALIFGFAHVNPTSAATTYMLTDLGTLGGSNSYAVDINEVGQVIGYSSRANGNYHAFVWEDGVMTDLGDLGLGFSNVADINDAGQVAGSSRLASGIFHAFVWEDGVMTDLGDLGGGYSTARAINEAGQVIGQSYPAGKFANHAFLWEDGVMTDLGTLGGNASTPNDINDAGQVIGDSSLANGNYHAFLWENGVMTDLGTLGGSSSQAFAINEAGQVVGYSRLANGSYHAFLWEDGVMTDLGAFSGNDSTARAINEAGQIIGYSRLVNGSEHAFLWENGVMTDLGTFGGSSSNPSAINEAGQVVGGASLAGNIEVHAFLWENGVMTDLGTLGGNPSYARAINEAGQVVGHSRLANGSEHAFVTTPSNQPPTAGAGGPYDVDEAGSVMVIASGTDPENGPLTYAWDLDNNGVFETPGQSVTFSAAELDGLSSQTINVQVTDEGGLTAMAQSTVNVLNIAPTATFTSTSTPIIVGQSLTLSFSNPFDPGAEDVATGLLYSYDCTKDGSFEATNSPFASFDCPYAAAGAFTALGRIADNDGGFTDYTVEIRVLTPSEGTAGLIEQVKALVKAGTLNQGQGNALIAKLDGTLKQLEKGKTNTAINELQAFINQVNDLINTGTLSAEEPLLIEAANAIIAALGG